MAGHPAKAKSPLPEKDPSSEKSGFRSISDRDQPSVDQEILNLPQAAAFLGVSSKTFQKVLRETDVPGRKVGREWKFSRTALAQWVGAGRSRDFQDASDDEPELPARKSTRARRRGREELRAEED